MQDNNIDYLRRLDHLIAETIAIPSPERKNFLEKESNEDTGIRRDVLDMLERGVSLNKSKAEIIDMIHSISDSTTLPGVHASRPYKYIKDAYNLLGKTILHYDIISLLGGGGMGVVYRGKDTRLDRFVALKFLSPRLIENQETKQRFLNEARAASKLDHQNIGVIHEICDTEDQKSFIVMALYEGQTLKDRMHAERLSPQVAIDYALQIAEGLQYSHKKGIVHRDIKPSNIIITREGQVKIVDFGLALFIDRPLPDDTKKIMGTMGYMAPEQRRGGKTDFRTDIWSMGVILHEMLLGTRPDITKPSFLSTPNDPPESYSFPFKSLNTSRLSKILSKTLQPDPDKRYASVSDLISDLRKASPRHDQRPPIVRAFTNRSVIWTFLIALLFIPLLFTLISPSSIEEDFGQSIGIQLLDFSNENEENEENESYLSSGVTEEIISQVGPG